MSRMLCGVMLLAEGLLLGLKVRMAWSVFHFWSDKRKTYIFDIGCVLFVSVLFFIIGKEWMVLQFLDLLLSYLLLSVIDLRTHQIPNAFLIYMGISQLLYRFQAGPIEGIVRELFIGFIVLVFFLFVCVLTKGSMGMGDAKLLGLTAVFTGIGYLIQMIFWGMLCAFVFSVLLLASKKGNKKTELPFVPFLLGGMVLHIGTWIW